MHLLDIVDIFSSHDYEVIIRATQAPKDAYEKVKNMTQTNMIWSCAAEETVHWMR